MQCNHSKLYDLARPDIWLALSWYLMLYFIANISTDIMYPYWKTYYMYIPSRKHAYIILISLNPTFV